MKAAIGIIIVLILSTTAFAIHPDSLCGSQGPYIAVRGYEWNGSDYLMTRNREIMGCEDTYLVASLTNVGWRYQSGCRGLFVAYMVGPDKTPGRTGNGVETAAYDRNEVSEMDPAANSTALCYRAGQAPVNDGGASGVPEFNTGTLFLAVAGAGLGLAMLRKGA